MVLQRASGGVVPAPLIIRASGTDGWSHQYQGTRIFRCARKQPKTATKPDTPPASRWALLKAPDKLTDKQQATLSDLEAANSPLYRAYLLKEQLRLLLKLPGEHAKPLVDEWLGWASRSRLEPFVELARSIRRLRTQIDAMLDHGLTNGRVESINAKIRLIQQRAFGFHDPFALIALAKLTLSGYCPPLRGRTG
jgi:transposase